MERPANLMIISSRRLVEDGPPFQKAAENSVSPYTWTQTFLTILSAVERVGKPASMRHCRNTKASIDAPSLRSQILSSPENVKITIKRT
jgi:hypothetical protein